MSVEFWHRWMYAVRQLERNLYDYTYSQAESEAPERVGKIRTQILHHSANNTKVIE